MSNASTSEACYRNCWRFGASAARAEDGFTHWRIGRCAGWSGPTHRMRKDGRSVWMGHEGQLRTGTGEKFRTCTRGLKAKRYRHQPIRSVHIPRLRERRGRWDLGVRGQASPDAVREVLEAIYEQDFLDCSYGFRPWTQCP